MVWIGKDPKDHLVSMSCHGQGHVKEAKSQQKICLALQESYTAPEDYLHQVLPELHCENWSRSTALECSFYPQLSLFLDFQSMQLFCRVFLPELNQTRVGSLCSRGEEGWQQWKRAWTWE